MRYILGVYDKNAPEDLLRSEPHLYRPGRLGKAYRMYSFWLTMCDAFYQSIAIFFICLCTYYDTPVDIFSFGTVCTTACMFVMLLHAAVEIRSWVSKYISQFYTLKYFFFF